MSYIWEEYSDEKKFRTGECICPYLEIFENNLTDVEVNPMLRFSEIIDLDTIKFDDNGDVQNIIFHYLAQLDMVKGLSYFQSVIECIRGEIEKGYWGKRVLAIWDMLSFDDQNIIISVLAQRILNDNKTYFMDVIGKLFSEASLCYEKKTNLYYLYIRADENKYNINLSEIAKILFWNINKDILLVWKNHYGIVGTNDTMQIGKIQVV